MPEINPKLSDEQMKELEDEELRNATVRTETGIQDAFKKTTIKPRSSRKHSLNVHLVCPLRNVQKQSITVFLISPRCRSIPLF